MNEINYYFYLKNKKKKSEYKLIYLEVGRKP